ncbi:MAG: hypothetical protein EOO53_14520 [Gammaproteobacteria bacterium]|nr:MAG: hypothetical protein EOO53_14520 [Gammaproteobacteria bacterium]
MRSFAKLLGDGSNFLSEIDYLVKPNLGGLAQAFIIGDHLLAASKYVLYSMRIFLCLKACCILMEAALK